MKGVILAGGKGTRLMPMTKVTNKHLLPVGGKPMIQHCVEKLVEAEIRDILVVAGGDHIGHLAEFLGSGLEFGCQTTYRVQDAAGGIAQALGLAEGFIRDGESMCVLLGDNIFQDGLAVMVRDYENFLEVEYRAMVVLNRVGDPERFGVAEVNEELNEIVSIEEKPKKPKSNWAVTGIYFYDFSVFEIVGALEPSDRGELEITDVNNAFLERGELAFHKMKGWWTDAGTPDSYARANKLLVP
jgi:glucose-1-phosphate thymidylyltransferase